MVDRKNNEWKGKSQCIFRATGGLQRIYLGGKDMTEEGEKANFEGVEDRYRN